jgi:hypothetical protein
MRPALHLASLVCALSALPVLGGELINPTIDVSDVRVVVRRLSAVELANLQRQYGLRVPNRDIRQSNRHGFSVLKRNLETGAFTCEIYLPADKRPRLVDDEATLTIGHELLHCLLGDYHR